MIATMIPLMASPLRPFSCARMRHATRAFTAAPLRNSFHRDGIDQHVDGEIGQPLGQRWVIEIDPDLDHASVGARRRIDVEHVILEHHAADAHDPAGDRARQCATGDRGRLPDPDLGDIRFVDLGNRAHLAGVTHRQYRAVADVSNT